MSTVVLFNGSVIYIVIFFLLLHRASSVQSLRKDTPQSVVTAGLDTLEGVTQGEEEVYLSEDAEMEEEDAAEGQEWVLAEMHEELPPEQSVYYAFELDCYIVIVYLKNMENCMYLSYVGEGLL